MNLEMYYYNLSIRLFALIALSGAFSGLYWKYLNDADEQSFLREEKSIYGLHFGFWLLFLSNGLAFILPSNVFGFFVFELIVFSIIFISMTFLLWKKVRKATFHPGVLLLSLPLFLLFVVALGMD